MCSHAKTSLTEFWPAVDPVKQLIKKMPLIGPSARRLHARYREWQLDAARNIERVLGGFETLDFAQIGSNDGQNGDPVRKIAMKHPQWRGLFVEPVPHLFARLKSNYGANGRFQFEQVAIAKTASIRPFYFVTDNAKAQLTDLPVWFDQLGSFDRNHILKHFGERVVPFIAAINVECVTLADLFRRHPASDLQLLHIDTEGYDWEVLRQLDLQVHAPKVILFEHKHLSIYDRNAAMAFLSPQYEIRNLGADFFCVRHA